MVLYYLSFCTVIRCLQIPLIIASMFSSISFSLIFSDPMKETSKYSTNNLSIIVERRERPSFHLIKTFTLSSFRRISVTFGSVMAKKPRVPFDYKCDINRILLVYSIIFNFILNLRML